VRPLTHKFTHKSTVGWLQNKYLRVGTNVFTLLRRQLYDQAVRLTYFGLTSPVNFGNDNTWFWIQFSNRPPTIVRGRDATRVMSRR